MGGFEKIKLWGIGEIGNSGKLEVGSLGRDLEFGLVVWRFQNFGEFGKQISE